MRELALHLMDIAENGVAAGATRIEIHVREDLARDRLWMQVRDNGKGMDAEMVAKVTDPFVTTRTTRKVGLGIPLLKEAAEICQGGLTIHSTRGTGTEVSVEFQRSHIDRMPLGDLAGSILSLIIGHPSINWVFNYEVDGAVFAFDDRPIKQELDGISLTEPDVIQFIREMLEAGVESVTNHVAAAR